MTKVIYTGQLSPFGQTCEMRRVALERLGYTTAPVDYMVIARSYPRWFRRVQWRLRLGPMMDVYNQELCRQMQEPFDCLWVDKGMFVRPETIALARQAGAKVVHYSPDNYFLAQNTSRHFEKSLPAYDLIATTKTDNVARLKQAGAREVFLSGNAYDPAVHFPMSREEALRRAPSCDVTFVGRWEPEREVWLERVAQTGASLCIRGFQWDKARSPAVRRAVRSGPALGLDYTAAICAAKINLAFLSRLAGDTITQRSVEIPACGAFMLAERTEEHLSHFAEGREAAYFEGVDEMLEKITYYLAHERERQAIAAAGRLRCETSGYSYDARLQQILSAARLQP